MKTFKTIEELVEFVNDRENIETLDSGEVAIRDWNEDAKALRKYWKNHEQVTSDKKAWDSQKEELTQRIAELTEQLDSTSNELAGLKEVNYGDDKKMLQKLNADIVCIKAKNTILERQVATIPDLKRKVEEWNSSRILEAARKAAAYYNVPQNIIDDPDFKTIVVSDLTIDDIGNVFVKDDNLQSAHDYIAAKQKDRPHWKPMPNENSGGSGMISDDQAAVASLFSQGGSNVKYTQPAGRDDRLTDDLAAVAALFG